MGTLLYTESFSLLDLDVVGVMRRKGPESLQGFQHRKPWRRSIFHGCGDEVGKAGIWEGRELGWVVGFVTSFRPLISEYSLGSILGYMNLKFRRKKVGPDTYPL